MGAFAAWPAVAGLGLYFGWTVVVVRDLVRCGRPFTARFWGFSVEVGAERS